MPRSPSSEMLDPRLAAELAALEREPRPAPRKVSHAAAGPERFPVLIEAARPIGVRPVEIRAAKRAARSAAAAGPRKRSADELRSGTARAQERLHGALVRLGVPPSQIRTLWLANAISTSLTAEQIERIAGRADVRLVRLERPEKVTCLKESVPLVHAPAVWAAGSGPTGSGVRVAVLDSGVFRFHAAFGGRVVEEFDTSGEGLLVPGLHGTHVAGIVASEDATYRGVAWRATLVNAKVLNHDGVGTPTAVVRGLETALQRQADVLNLSLGWSHLPPTRWICARGDCVLCRAVDNAVELGAVVVVAAGNEGDAGAGTADTSLRCPANARGAITVAATDKRDRLAAFSSRGPTPYGAAKPDVAAPGDAITSAGTYGFVALSGTSMAAPHVSGLAALLLQRYPYLVGQDVKHLVSSTALDVAYAAREQGAGRVDAAASFAYFSPAGAGADVFIQDHVRDVGRTPVAEPPFESPDVWSQLVATGREASGLVEPHQRPEFGQPNYVFVRVHNRGQAFAARVDATLGTCGFSTLPSGWEIVGTKTTRDLLPGQTRVLGPFPWVPPRIGHGCFKAGLDEPGRPLPASWLAISAPADNNVAQRNVDVVDAYPGGRASSSFEVAGFPDRSAVVTLEVDATRLPSSTRLRLNVPARFAAGTTLVGLGVEARTSARTTLLLGAAVGRIERLELKAGERSRVTLAAYVSQDVLAGTLLPVYVRQLVDDEVAGSVALLVAAAGSGAAPYVANARSGSREVHRVGGCPWEARIRAENRIPHRSLEELVQRGFPAAGRLNGCRWCLPEFHVD